MFLKTPQNRTVSLVRNSPVAGVIVPIGDVVNAVVTRDSPGDSTLSGGLVGLITVAMACGNVIELVSRTALELTGVDW